MTDLVIVRLVHISACAIAFGMLTFVFCLPPGGGSDSMRTRLGKALRTWALASGAVALVSWLLWLLALAPVMSGLPRAEAWSRPILVSVVTETWFGSVWLTRLVLLLLCVLLLWSKRDISTRGTRFATTLLLLGLATAFIAGVGHANREAGVNGDVHLVGDALHLLGAGAWLGGLLPLIIMFRARYAPHGPERHAKDATFILNRFSDLALWAVGSLVVGAAVNTWYMIPNVSVLWSRVYGGMVLAKAVLLVAMLTLAARNKLVLVPRFAQTASLDEGAAHGAAAELKRNILVEFGAGAVILVIVSVMGITSP